MLYARVTCDSHSLFSQTRHLQKELLRQVDLGPFKHTIDDGLELRKAVFECLDALLEKALVDLVMIDFVSALSVGLSDPDYDIRMLVHLILCKLCQMTPAALIPGFVTPVLSSLVSWPL